MTPSTNNRAVIAAAGSRKTQLIVDEALANPTRRVLITTYTLENLKELTSRLSRLTGTVPDHITVTSWYSFLLSDCVRPYQRSVVGEPNLISGINFVTEKLPRGIPVTNTRKYFLDNGQSVYKDRVSHLAYLAEQRSNGRVTNRLSQLYDHVYIDEVQDLSGYDLHLLDCIMRSPAGLTVVGDPRQCTYLTTRSPKNKQYQKVGIMKWLAARKSVCKVEFRQDSYRCNQEICDFADDLYPDLERTVSRNNKRTGHDGIFYVKHSEAVAYAERHHPVTVLRYDKRKDTLNLPATNFGESKGSTHARVLIFPTKSMEKYLTSRNPDDVDSKAKFYVAITRAQHSVAFVVPDRTTLSCFTLE